MLRKNSRRERFKPMLVMETGENRFRSSLAQFQLLTFVWFLRSSSMLLIRLSSQSMTYAWPISR